MAITFTNARYFRTDVGPKIFQNVPTASQWFKILVTSKSVVASQTGFLSKIQFDFWHQFMGLGTNTTIPVRFACTNSVGTFAQVDISLTIGVSYGIAVTWDGVAGHQKVWISGVPTQFGTFTGNTQNNSSALQFGVSAGTINFTLDDHNVWNNYLLTSDDIASLLGGTNPTTIGTSRDMEGSLDNGGNERRQSDDRRRRPEERLWRRRVARFGGDGSDCISAGGAGSAVYAPSLVWAPQVAPTPAYIDTCGKVAVVHFTSLVNGTRVTPSQILTTPTISQNGVSLGALGTPWFTGYHPFAWWPLPAGVQIAPSDTVTLTAPTAWANTLCGAVEAMDSLQIANLTGKSVVRADDYVPTLDIGVNNPQSPMTIWGFYNPLKNWKYRTYGGRGKYTSPGPWAIYANSGVNGIDQTNYPGPPGLWCVMWDAGNPSAPTQFSVTTSTPATTAITERMDLRASPPSGIGMCRVFDVEHVSSTGSADLAINLSISGTINYSNLWIVGPGDFDIVNGAVVLDRSDPFALSRVYMSRVPSNVGSLRWEDSTIGGNPFSFPYPESLRSLTDESWSDVSFTQTKIGYSQVGPVNTTATPYIYSQFLGKPGALGETFAATLSSPITTTPPSGTKETYTFSDAATAPLMAGLELQIDSEVMRVVSVSGTSVVVNRGSNNTTPAAHSAGTVTVFGRTAITRVLNSSGSIANGLSWQLTTSVPHGVLTGTTMECDGSYPTLTFSDGETVNLSGFARQAYATGPNTAFMVIGATGSGGVLTSSTTLDPATHFWDRRWPAAATMPHEACAVITGKFPNANLHVNIWPDACDDLVYEIARRVLANFPSGRKVYVEYNNEPWNWAFGGFYYHTAVMGGLVLPSKPYNLAHYAFRAFQVHDIFRAVFAAADRGGEIMGILNCQMGNSDAQSHLNYAITLNKPVDAIAIAPYVSTEDTAYNNGLLSTLDDEQAISMFVHDLWYNPNTYNAYAATDKGYIKAYNTSTGRNCILLGYEGGIEFVLPNNTSITRREPRNHDCVTNPNWYNAEQDFYAWLQMQGFDHLHVYALAMFWGPQAWGMYHGILQDHGRGDGSDGKLNNLLCRANPTATHYKGASVNQDMNTVSVRGQAFIDWLADVANGPTPPATAYTVTAPTPAIGLINTASGDFTVQPNGPYTGTITITPRGGGLSTPFVLTWSSSSAAQTFTITPTSTDTVTLTPTNSGSLTNPNPVTYATTSATAYIFTTPSQCSGLVGVASDLFTVQPNGPYTGTITVTPSGGGLTAPIVLTWANSSTTQTFSIVPTLAGTVSLTPTNSGNLTDEGILTYTVTAPPPGTTRTPWLGSWFGSWFAPRSSVDSGKSNSTSAAGGVVQGGASAVSFHDVEAPRKRIMFVPWSRCSYRQRGR